MASVRRKFAYVSTLPPFPEGWYFITTRQALTKYRLIQKTWMGENIVVWSGTDGRVCVAEAICPHLGADLGPAAGGRVFEGRLLCPFHGFEFDTAGQCVATPFAPPPRTAELRVYRTQEVLGLIFAWWGIGGREPQWMLPNLSPDQDGWSEFEINSLRFPGHPQETTENAVDLAHLRYVHGYDNVEPVKEISVAGSRLEAHFNFKRKRTVAKGASLTFDVSARTSVIGLGYSLVEIRERSIGMDARLWVLATPMDGNFIELTLVSQVREIRNPNRLLVGLGFLPVKFRAPIMNKFIASQQREDVLQDVVIWRNKQYRSRPRLSRSDGKIMPFRHYCAQFYGEAHGFTDSPDIERPNKSQGVAS